MSLEAKIVVLGSQGERGVGGGGMGDGDGGEHRIAHVQESERRRSCFAT